MGDSVSNPFAHQMGKATFEYLIGFPDYRVILGDQQVGGYFWIPLSINVGFGGSTKSFLGEDDWM